MDFEQLKESNQKLDKYYFEYTNLWWDIVGASRLSMRKVITVEADSGTNAILIAMKGEGLAVTEENAERFKFISREQYEIAKVKDELAEAERELGSLRNRVKKVEFASGFAIGTSFISFVISVIALLFVSAA